MEMKAKSKFCKFSLLFLILFLSFGALIGVPKIGLYAAIVYLFCVIWKKEKNLYHSAVLLFLMFTASYYFPHFLWNIPAAGFFVPLFLSTLFVYPFKKDLLHWLRRGEVDQISWALVAITSCVSALALILWAYWSENLGAGVTMMQGLLSFPIWLILILAIPLFAIVNALAEEFVYRGVLQEALEIAFPQKENLVLVLQASAFAAAHVASGFPNGKVGYLMTFSYALMLGFLKRRTGGILAPYVAHVVADLVIGYYLYFQAV